MNDDAKEPKEPPTILIGHRLELPESFQEPETWTDGARYVMKQVNKRHFRLEPA